MLSRDLTLPNTTVFFSHLILAPASGSSLPNALKIRPLHPCIGSPWQQKCYTTAQNGRLVKLETTNQPAGRSLQRESTPTSSPICLAALVRPRPRCRAAYPEASCQRVPRQSTGTEPRIIGQLTCRAVRLRVTLV